MAQDKTATGRSPENFMGGMVAILRMALAVAFVTFVGLSTYNASTAWLAEASVAADNMQRDLLDSTLNYAAIN